MKDYYIIDGKRYNPATAEEVAHYWNGLGGSDFRNLSETLYRTKKGQFFLLGKGGAMTKYAESQGNSSWGSSRCEVLSDAEAFSWLEEHEETAALEAYFSDRIQDA